MASQFMQSAQWELEQNEGGERGIELEQEQVHQAEEGSQV